MRLPRGCRSFSRTFRFRARSERGGWVCARRRAGCVEKIGFSSTKISNFQLILMVYFLICAATRFGPFFEAFRGARIWLKSAQNGRQKRPFFLRASAGSLLTKGACASADLLPGFSAAACAQTKVSVEGGLQPVSALQSCLYKTIRLILEKYPTLSRVWVGKYRTRLIGSARTFCVSPGRRVSAFWLNAQKRLKGEFLLPEYVTKLGKVLISLIPFCQRFSNGGELKPSSASA